MAQVLPTRVNLPEPVFPKRLAALRFVFILGMADSFCRASVEALK
jgi:hypothetical protein